MAHITANAQIPQHSLIFRRFSFLLLHIFFLGVSFSLIGQTPYQPKKKALKLYEKAEQYIKLRDFDEGIANYAKAIEVDPLFAKAYFRLGRSFEVLRKLDTSFYYFDKYRQLLGMENLSFDMSNYLIDLYIKQGDYKLADSMFSKVKRPDKDQMRYDLLSNRIAYIRAGIKNPTIFEVEILPDSVNRFYNQYFPSITVDNSQLIFTARDGKTRYDDENLMISYYDGVSWSAARNISPRINSPFNEGASAISADGRTLIFTSCEEERTIGSCDLFISYKTGDEWSKPRNMGRTINSRYWDSQPSLSADGRILYFSSYRPGGYGKRDIWKSTYKNQQWTVPVNAGDSINSHLDDITPYLHVNNQTLFFSSEGHSGFGGFDLFSVEINDSIISAPQNLGFGINNHLDQLSMIITADGKNAFFAQELINDQNERISKIASIKFDSTQLVSSSASYVVGRVTDAESNKPLRARIALNKLDDEHESYETLSDEVSGEFFFVLTEGNTYGVFVDSKGYLFEDFLFDVKSLLPTEPDTLNIKLEPIRKGLKTTLENIYFEFDSYRLSPDSRSELSAVVKYLLQNEIKVEIGGHTDAKGDPAYNMELSTKRAETVHNYLIEKGVPSYRLSYQGYGATQPANVDDLLDAKNRRIEFTITRE